MKILKKYHKQGISKIKSSKYQSLNKEFGLGYSLKDDYGQLMLSVFEKGLHNKTQVEKVYERTRNEHFDMWDNLMNTERNTLLDHAMNPLRKSMTQFDYENHKIMIPFFDALLNDLYYKETAILELPQFHRLYDDFKKQVQPIENYGNLPLKADMSFASFVVEDQNKIVLFSKDLQSFYLVDNRKVIRYPLSQVNGEDVLTIATSILFESSEEVLRLLIQKNCLNPKAAKKIGKKLNK